MRRELPQHKHPVIFPVCPVFKLNLREYLLLFNLQITVHNRHNSAKKKYFYVFTLCITVCLQKDHKKRQCIIIVLKKKTFI